MKGKRVKKTADEWRRLLSPEVFRVTREKGTERPFTGEYVHKKDKGLYRCSNCGAPLFDSNDKFDSGSGWPSFSSPAEEGAVRTEPDKTHGMDRTEVLCAACDAHLGHVFDDGPGPDGKRYCVNSVALKFEDKGQE